MAEINPYQSPTDTSRLFWVDCEFTGLPLEQGHRIIEIGATVTNLALEELDAYESFVHYDWPTIESLMNKNPWWDHRDSDRARMHKGTTLGKTVSLVDLELASLVDEYFEDTKPPLCGNSIFNDRKHIEDQMPALTRRLHYQGIDVTSLKLIAQKYLGIEYRDKSHHHHALSDVRESVDELRFLMKRLGIRDVNQIIER